MFNLLVWLALHGLTLNLLNRLALRRSALEGLLLLRGDLAT